MYDGKGLMQYGDKVLPMIAKIFGSHLEKMMLNELKAIKNDSSLESYKDNNDEPFLQLAYLILKDKNYLKERKSKNHLYSDLDLRRPYIFDFEYDYFSKIIDSSLHWENVASVNGGKTYFSDSNFVPNSPIFMNASNAMIVRTINEPFEKVIRSSLAFKTMTDSDHTLTYYGVREKIHSMDIKTNYPNLSCQDIPCLITEIDTKIPFPLNTPRKSISIEGFKFIDENTLIRLARPYTGDFVLKDNVDFTKKLQFNYHPDSKSDKQIETEGYIIPFLQLSKFEKIDDQTTKCSEFFSSKFL